MEAIRQAEKELADLNAERLALPEAFKSERDPDKIFQLQERARRLPLFIAAARRNVELLKIDICKAQLKAIDLDIRRCSDIADKKTIAYRAAKKEWQEANTAWSEVQSKRWAVERELEQSQNNVEALERRITQKAMAA